MISNYKIPIQNVKTEFSKSFSVPLLYSIIMPTLLSLSLSLPKTQAINQFHNKRIISNYTIPIQNVKNWISKIGISAIVVHNDNAKPRNPKNIHKIRNKAIWDWF